MNRCQIGIDGWTYVTRSSLKLNFFENEMYLSYHSRNGQNLLKSATVSDNKVLSLYKGPRVYESQNPASQCEYSSRLRTHCQIHMHLSRCGLLPQHCLLFTIDNRICQFCHIACKLCVEQQFSQHCSAFPLYTTQVFTPKPSIRPCLPPSVQFMVPMVLSLHHSHQHSNTLLTVTYVLINYFQPLMTLI